MHELKLKPDEANPRCRSVGTAKCSTCLRSRAGLAYTVGFAGTPRMRRRYLGGSVAALAAARAPKWINQAPHRLIKWTGTVAFWQPLALEFATVERRSFFRLFTWQHRARARVGGLAKRVVGCGARATSEPKRAAPLRSAASSGRGRVRGAARHRTGTGSGWPCVRSDAAGVAETLPLRPRQTAHRRWVGAARKRGWQPSERHPQAHSQRRPWPRLERTTTIL